LYPADFSSSCPEVARGVTERARDRIDAFATEPIKISEVAEDLGVTVRALQLGFHKRYGCSPLQYLLARRIELARGRLQSPAPGDTVTSVATESGFINLGAFARRYRSRYGENPSDTLSRAKRRSVNDAPS
jgi:AraC-like DNA-binding protein